jgi:lysophospholipase L1-like esterase
MSFVSRAAAAAGAAIAAFAALVVVQLLRLRRLEFLPAYPGFYINHRVAPPGADDRPALRLVVLGDSTTAGVGVDRPEDALPHLIAERVARIEGRNVHVVSYGWAGARVADLERIQLPRALEPLRATETEPFLPAADIVAVVIGANDATHNTRPDRYRESLRATLEGIRAAAPGARLVLAGIPRFRGALSSVAPLITLADLYATLLRPISASEARRVGAAYADLAREVPRRIAPGTDVLAVDRFHPSVVGYRLWADVITEALEYGAPILPATRFGVDAALA